MLTHPLAAKRIVDDPRLMHNGHLEHCSREIRLLRLKYVLRRPVAVQPHAIEEVMFHHQLAPELPSRTEALAEFASAQRKERREFVRGAERRAKHAYPPRNSRVNCFG
jgi:hypothetical protein